MGVENYKFKLGEKVKLKETVMLENVSADETKYFDKDSFVYIVALEEDEYDELRYYISDVSLRQYNQYKKNRFLLPISKRGSLFTTWIRENDLEKHIPTPEEIEEEILEIKSEISSLVEKVKSFDIGGGNRDEKIL